MGAIKPGSGKYTAIGLPPGIADENPAARDAIIETLDQRRVALLDGRDPAKDLEGLELLLQECEKQLGRLHWVTLLTKTAKSVKLGFLGRNEEAVQIGYEASARLVAHYGLREPLTVDANLWIMNMLATCVGPELFDFIYLKLGWLLKCDPASLDPKLLAMKQEAENTLHRWGSADFYALWAKHSQ